MFPMTGRRLEIGLLIALCIFLPLYEAPKSIAWLAYTLVWVVNRLRSSDFGGRWDAWDTLILLWLASGFVIAPFAALHGSEWRGSFDIVRNAGILWLVKRSRLVEGEARAVLGALVGSAIVGFVMGYARLRSGAMDSLQINSVGHVNDTATYLAIMLGLCASWLFSGRDRMLAGAATGLMLVALFVTASRAGVAAGLITLVVLALACWRRTRIPAALVAAVLVSTGVLAASGGAEVFERQAQMVAAGHMLSLREEVWALALSNWRSHPWFGVGIDNFKLTTTAFENPVYRELMPHAHSLYLNTLAERGIVGALPVAALLVVWGLRLYRRRPGARDAGHAWLLWGAAASAWIVTVLIGAVNTTLHHEYGLLAALLLGLWLSATRRRADEVRLSRAGPCHSAQASATIPPASGSPPPP